MPSFRWTPDRAPFQRANGDTNQLVSCVLPLQKQNLLAARVPQSSLALSFPFLLTTLPRRQGWLSLRGILQHTYSEKHCPCFRRLPWYLDLKINFDSATYAMFIGSQDNLSWKGTPQVSGQTSRSNQKSNTHLNTRAKQWERVGGKERE